MDLSLVGRQILLGFHGVGGCLVLVSHLGDGEVGQSRGHHQRAGDVRHQDVNVEQQHRHRRDQVADDQAEQSNDADSAEDQLDQEPRLTAGEHHRQEGPQGQNDQQQLLEHEVQLE